MPTFLLDAQQIEDNTRLIEELKVSIQALTATLEDYVSKDATTDEERDKLRIEFSVKFAGYLNKIRGVDILTNLNTGRILLTKYSKEPKAIRWEIHENTDSTT
jgi:hypothetical protein